QPVSLEIQPAEIVLAGRRAVQQIVVTGKYADGSARDLTHVAEIKAEGDVAFLDGDLFLTPKKDGTAHLIAKAGNQRVRASITVRDFAKAQQVSFRNEVIAALNVGGCNSGACHGTPSGKNGFKLSLRGYDPASDYVQLTRDVLGRRTTRQNASASLIMQ